MFKKINKYLRLAKNERKLLNQTFTWLMYAFVLVRFIPLRWFNSILGEFRLELKSIPKDKDIETITLVRRNIKRIKRILPWEVKCFEEAIAAKKVLEIEYIKTTLHLGVSKSADKKMIAHAWLKMGDYFISGKQGVDKFKVVGFYS